LSSTLEGPLDVAHPASHKPRLGFLGLGWIGRHRLESVAQNGAADIVVVADTAPETLAEVADGLGALGATNLEDLLATGVDGVVIATPSALHAEQARLALEGGAAVFCQKPLGRTAHEVHAVIDSAKRSDRLLGVDLSYRYIAGMCEIKRLMDEGELGKVYAMELTFHNAYGPDKPWFLDPGLSGGGCAIDLGTHLVDLALWTLNWPIVRETSSRLFTGGRLMPPGAAVAEDYAIVQLDLADDIVARLTCSWFLPAGRDAVIDVTVYGTKAAASLRNQDGSFYDFVSQLHVGTSSRTLAEPPDAWGERAILDWVSRLAAGEGFSARTSEFESVATVIDAIYGRRP
jgi:predicted dehydrogenase